jgi:hypothetical protein
MLLYIITILHIIAWLGERGGVKLPVGVVPVLWPGLGTVVLQPYARGNTPVWPLNRSPEALCRGNEISII